MLERYVGGIIDAEDVGSNIFTAAFNNLGKLSVHIVPLCLCILAIDGPVTNFYSG